MFQLSYFSKIRMLLLQFKVLSCSFSKYWNTLQYIQVFINAKETVQIAETKLAEFYNARAPYIQQTKYNTTIDLYIGHQNNSINTAYSGIPYYNLHKRPRKLLTCHSMKRSIFLKKATRSKSCKKMTKLQFLLQISYVQQIADALQKVYN